MSRAPPYTSMAACLRGRGVEDRGRRTEDGGQKKQKTPTIDIGGCFFYGFCCSKAVFIRSSSSRSGRMVFRNRSTSCCSRRIVCCCSAMALCMAAFSERHWCHSSKTCDNIFFKTLGTALFLGKSFDCDKRIYDSTKGQRTGLWVDGLGFDAHYRLWLWLWL